jgi:FkbM family methyltransferase
MKRIIWNLLYSTRLTRLTTPLFSDPIKSDKYSYYLKSLRVSWWTKLKVMLGSYEKPEIGFVDRYFTSSIDSVELGGSLGVLSTHLVQRTADHKSVIVEADPELFQILSTNVRSNFPNAKVQLVNAAVAAGDDVGETITFFTTYSTSTGGSVSRHCDGRTGSITVPAVSLSQLLQRYEVGSYQLMCDIEGGEIALLLHDSRAFANCERMILELHDCNYNSVQYTRDMIAELICKLGFRQIDQTPSGDVRVFEAA